MNLVRLMIRKYCDFDCSELVNMAAKYGEEEVAVWIINNFGFKQRSGSMLDLFCVAINRNQVSLIQTLMMYECPLERDEHGKALLHFAAEQDRLGCVKALLNAKAPLLI